MNLLKYLSKMFLLGSTAKLVGIIMLITFLTLVILKTIGGMRRGFIGQLLKTASTLLCAALSCLAASLFVGKIENFVDTFSLAEAILTILNLPPELAKILGSTISTINMATPKSMILTVATLLVAPAIAVLTFLTLRLIFYVFRSTVGKVIKPKKAKNTPSRLGGALLGTVEAFLCLIIIALPFSGIITLTDGVREIRESEVEGFVEPGNIFMDILDYIECLSTNTTNQDSD